MFASSAVPELRALVGTEAVEELRSSLGDSVQTRLVLKKCFTRMMNCEKKLFVDQLNLLVKRVTEEGEQTQLQPLLTCLLSALKEKCQRFTSRQR